MTTARRGRRARILAAVRPAAILAAYTVIAGVAVSFGFALVALITIGFGPL